MTTRQIGSKYPASPTSESEQLTIFANAGIYTCIVGYAATIDRINMTSGGKGLCAPIVIANTGIITALSAGNNANMTIDAGPAGQIKSFQFESVAANVPPIKTSSTAKCVNLNVDLLDGLTTKDTNWTSGASVMTRDSNGSTKANVITATLFQGGTGAFPTAITGNNATIGGNNEINNLEVTGSFTAATGTNFAGNADTATLAANIQIGANRVPYNNANNSTTSSGNLVFNGTTLTVNSLTVSSTASCSINGNSATTTLASNLSGSTNRIPYNTNSTTTTTSSNLQFNGTNLSVGGDITAFASDIRLKTNIEQIEGAVAKVCKLSGFTYEFNETGKGLDLPTGRHLGVSAQEVQEVFPEAVTTRLMDDYLTVKYEKLVPVLIEAIKELKGEIEELKNGG